MPSDADHTRTAQAARHLDPRRRQPLGHDVSRALFLEPKFGMGVQIASQRCQVGKYIGGHVGHLGTSRRNATPSAPEHKVPPA